jgi:hypothetical protein
MTRNELEEILLDECAFRVRRMSSDDLGAEVAAIENGLEMRLSPTPSRDPWICSSCRMDAIDCDCNPFGSNQVT